MAELGDLSVDRGAEDRPALPGRFHSKYAYGHLASNGVTLVVAWFALR